MRAFSFRYTALTRTPRRRRAVKASTGEIFVTILGELEVLNAFGLRVFRKEVTAAQAQSSLSDFEKDLRDGLFQLRGLPDPVFERARQLCRQTTTKLGTRTADISARRCGTRTGCQLPF